MVMTIIPYNLDSQGGDSLADHHHLIYTVMHNHA